MKNAAEIVYRNPQDVIEIGNNLRIAREKRGLSQEQFGQMTDNKYSVISRYERADVEMKIATLVQFMEALEVPADEILPSRLKRNGSVSSKRNRLIRLVESVSESDVNILLPLLERMAQE